MTDQLPQDVVEFLLANPEELKKLQSDIKATIAHRKWQVEMAEKRRVAPMVPCGTYGCKNLKNARDVFCKNCEAEYQEDPDAFK